MPTWQRKRSYYNKLPPLTGPWDRVFRLKPDRPPPWWAEFGHAPEEWRCAINAGKRRAGENFSQWVLAVYEHFGISSSAPGASKDLALSLAYRHERDLLVEKLSGRIRYAALCERYGVKPAEEGSDTTLALSLAYKYVEGEKKASNHESGNWGTRFTASELATLVMAVAAVREHIGETKKQRKCGSLAKKKPLNVRTIAKLLQDRRHLATIIPKKAAESVQAILFRAGNKRQDTQGPLGDTRVRQVIDEILTLGEALGSGKGWQMTRVQKQLYFSVVPLLAGLGD
jgi:hypothetical protein